MGVCHLAETRCMFLYVHKILLLGTSSLSKEMLKWYGLPKTTSQLFIFIFPTIHHLLNILKLNTISR
jgi:hypothetical protein